MIELEHINAFYAEGPALKDVTLSIKKGEYIALIGANGSGKSSLLRLLNGLLFADSGVYRFDGEPITRERLRDQHFAKYFHQRAGFLFQNSDAQLFCPTVYDEIAFGPRQLGISESETAARVQDLLAMFAIRPLASRAPYHLSGGEKRKVALAAVLSLNPEILCLDEPMNGLDPKTKHFFHDFLVSLKAAGKTVICATHDFSYIDGVFERAAVFGADHNIVKTGNYAEIISNTEFLELQNII